jgi:hypothetical protein
VGSNGGEGGSIAGDGGGGQGGDDCGDDSGDDGGGSYSGDDCDFCVVRPHERAARPHPKRICSDVRRAKAVKP